MVVREDLKVTKLDGRKECNLAIVQVAPGDSLTYYETSTPVKVEEEQTVVLFGFQEKEHIFLTVVQNIPSLEVFEPIVMSEDCWNESERHKMLLEAAKSYSNKRIPVAAGFKIYPLTNQKNMVMIRDIRANYRGASFWYQLPKEEYDKIS